MKFLTMATMKESIVALPPSVTLKLCEAATQALEQSVKEGKIKEFYYIPGWRFMLISEETSAEEMTKSMSKNPALGLMNFDVHPLADGVQAWKDGIENLKLAQKTAA